MLAFVVEADQFVNSSFLDVLLELLYCALTAEAMLALEFHSAKLTIWDRLTFRH